MFNIHQYDDGYTHGPVNMPCDNITPKQGMALYMASGVLAVASGANKAQFISLYESSSAVTSGTLIPVLPIDRSIVFESEWDETDTTNNIVGKVCDVSAVSGKAGLAVDGSSTSGENFIVEWSEGTSAGDKVRGRFIL